MLQHLEEINAQGLAKFQGRAKALHELKTAQEELQKLHERLQSVESNLKTAETAFHVASSRVVAQEEVGWMGISSSSSASAASSLLMAQDNLNQLDRLKLEKKEAVALYRQYESEWSFLKLKVCRKEISAKQLYTRAIMGDVLQIPQQPQPSQPAPPPPPPPLSWISKPFPPSIAVEASNESPKPLPSPSPPKLTKEESPRRSEKKASTPKRKFRALTPISPLGPTPSLKELVGGKKIKSSIKSPSASMSTSTASSSTTHQITANPSIAIHESKMAMPGKLRARLLKVSREVSRQANGGKLDPKEYLCKIVAICVLGAYKQERWWLAYCQSLKDSLHMQVVWIYKDSLKNWHRFPKSDVVEVDSLELIDVEDMNNEQDKKDLLIGRVWSENDFLAFFTCVNPNSDLNESEAYTNTYSSLPTFCFGD